MAGRKATRAGIDEFLKRAGKPALEPGKPVPPEIGRAYSIYKAAQEKERKLKKKVDDQRKRAREKSQDMTAEQLRQELRHIAVDASESATARIQAIRTLLESDGSDPATAKYTLELVLTPMSPNQEQEDYESFLRRPT